jgi:hypothetical protein
MWVLRAPERRRRNRRREQPARPALDTAQGFRDQGRQAAHPLGQSLPQIQAQIRYGPTDAAMTAIAMSPAELLFRDAEGKPTSLEDLIDDGLDRAYRDRIPALIGLLRDGAPRDRLYACMVLTAWGVAEGFTTLIGWAEQPDSAPWAGQPVEIDRRHGVDAAFERLADAVRSSLQLDPSPDLQGRQQAAVRALLGPYDRKFFGQAMQVVASDPAIRAGCGDAIIAAAAAAVRSSAAPPDPFDLGWQAALLLSPVARIDDARAAELASELLQTHSGRTRVAREVALSLGRGTGAATRRVLEELAASQVAAVASDAAAALGRRAIDRDCR